jgi:hypothetical protein
LVSLEKELGELRNKERSFEEGQEGFYASFKAAVAEVQNAKNNIGQWENRNREHVLQKERIDLRRDEILRQIAQAGRKAEDFAKAVRGASEAELADMERRIFRLRGDLASIGEVD